MKIFQLLIQRNYVKTKFVVLSFIAFFSVVYLFSTINFGFALEYANYTSNKYQIQFQYPSSWNVVEKTDRFDESTDIKIRKSPEGGSEYILIQFLDAAVANEMSTLGIAPAVNAMVEDTQADFSSENRIIEKPTFLSINGKQAGTFLYTSNDKYESDAPIWGNQVWTINLIDHAYFISFTATTDVFDTPENIQIRDQFIKSIKFLS